ncbi:MAG: MOSC N-terminal beta barrel domain-containing protein [Gemmatimonadales bacterium]|nr:MOSC N-terminal beta barrel domain-containing protein [Gemmatimonadales bacterium]
MHQPALALRLARLHVYPIKSAAGLAPVEWPVDGFGLRHDRRWMVVDARGKMLSQRTHPRLALARPSVVGDTLRVEAPGMPAIELPLEPVTRGGAATTVVVWDDTCSAQSTGQRPARWFSEFLETDCSLVYMPDSTVRPADPAYAPAGTRVSFADGFGFLLISEESLADLNGRLDSALPMDRFRPNLVIAGGEPFGEDAMTDFMIAGIRFQVVKPCDRCVITTTNQLTLERGPEPLRTLATYRRQGGKVLFGQNVVHQGTGRLRLGAPLQV